MLLVVDVGNTQTHLGAYRGDELVHDWRFATVRESTADELGAALRNLLALRGLALRRHRRVDRLLDRAAAAAGVDGDGRSATSATRCWSSARACGPGCRSATTTRARSAPTGSSTPSRATSASAAPCVIVDFGTAVTYDVGQRRRRVPRRRSSSPGVEISMEALTERAAALPKIDLTPPRALIGKSTVDAIRSGVIYGFAGMVDGIIGAPARGAGRGDRGARHRRPGRARSCRYCDARSTTSTTCSRSRACGSSGSATDA